MTEKELREQIVAENLIMIKFSANWCGPCKTYQKILDSVEAKYMILYCDVEECRDLSNEYKVNALPTSIFFKNAKEVFRMTGVQSKSLVEQMFDKLT